MFRTMKAKYPGTCKRCGGALKVGDTMRYGGPGRTYHLAAECPVGSKPRVVEAELVPSHLESSADAAGEWAVDAKMAEALADF